MQDVLNTACEAARVGGEILLRRLGNVTVQEKGPSDLVTDADFASQTAIEQLLTTNYPEFAFLGEESSEEQRAAAVASGKPIWVVDPLDGTANYVHRLPGFSVSIALVQGGLPTVGVVYDPLSQTLYCSTETGPATKNGSPIASSGCRDLSKAMVCCSFRPGVSRKDVEVAQFLTILERSRTLRRLGSAALNLCYLAEGCLDSYWASSIKTWDVAAGYLIAKNTGVVFNNPDGGEFDLWNPRFVASASTDLQQLMLQCLD